MKDMFLCHAGANKPWVVKLATRLEAETVGGRPVSVFLDEWDIDYGENILTRLETDLQEARFIAVVISAAFTRADWPRFEWQTRVWADPTGKKAKILPILLEKVDPATGLPIEIPLPLRTLRWLDFTDEKEFESSFAALLRRLRGEPPERGRHASSDGSLVIGSGSDGVVAPAAPDARDEGLVSNLLRVHSHPTRIWGDLTSATAHKEVWKALPRGARAPFLLNGGRLYCFYPPNDPRNPFRALLKGHGRSEERPLDWLADPIRSRQLMWLYNDSLREHAFKLGIRTPRIPGEKQTARQREQYYCPIINGNARTFRWAGGGRLRTLAKVGRSATGTTLGVHHSVRLRFMALADDAYLLVQPGWLFTTDGVTPLEGRLVGVLSTKYGGKERNRAVLRNVLMWGLLLAQGANRISLSLGAETLVLDTMPAHTRLNVGVHGDDMSLQRVLAGDGAGEVGPDSPYADPVLSATVSDDGELDDIIVRASSTSLESALVDDDDRSPDETELAGVSLDVAGQRSVHPASDDAPVPVDGARGQTPAGMRARRGDMGSQTRRHSLRSSAPRSISDRSVTDEPGHAPSPDPELEFPLE